MGNLPWAKILTVARRVATITLTGVQVSEQLAPKFGTPTGADKHDSVLELVQAELRAASSESGINLSENAQVMSAFGRLIDCYVDLHNTMAHEVSIGRGADRAGT